jgi:predicted secreted Zn-dependent protease
VAKSQIISLGGSHTCGKAKPRRLAGLRIKDDHRLEQMKSQVSNDIAEDVADNRAQKQQDGYDHDGHEYQNQGVLNQSLALLTRKEQHLESPPFFKDPQRPAM